MTLLLAGQVPVKVTTENGIIQKGDLLITSSTPGHAMKPPCVVPEIWKNFCAFTLIEAEKGMSPDDIVEVINQNEARRNSILGKALEPCKKSICKITALVTLQ